MTARANEAIGASLESVLPALRDLRHELHRHPTLSREEGPTAERIESWLSRCGPSEILSGLGGAGLAAVFEAEEPGPTVLLRAELDALPIPEKIDIAHGSASDGVSHKCGHDGHMAILAGVASLFGQHPPARGRVVAHFQPAEETGEGARAVLEDRRFAPIAPDFAFALHNVPGFPAGEIMVRPGAFASASQGLGARLRGSHAHASEPHLGKSPALALSQAIQALLALPAQCLPLTGGAAVTVTHARLGQPGFGTSPGAAELQSTLRATSDETLERLVALAEERIERIAESQGLATELYRRDYFAATVNAAAGAALVEAGAREGGLTVRSIEDPFPWSEDFGLFLGRATGALFGLGAGEACPALHTTDYDFPDQLIEPGVVAMYRAACRALASEPA